MMADDDGNDCDGDDDYDCVHNFHYRYGTTLYRYPPLFCIHRFKVEHRNLHLPMGDDRTKSFVCSHDATAWFAVLWASGDFVDVDVLLDVVEMSKGGDGDESEERQEELLVSIVFQDT